MSTEVDRLVVVFDANFSRMEEKLNKVVRANHAAASKVDKAWSGKSAASAGLNDLTSSLSSATSAVPGLGAALGGLTGPAAAAALAVGAVVIALKSASEAIAFGDEIADVAQKTGVSTDTLQELRYAVHATGGEFNDADGAITTFTQTLGKATLGAPKALKAFNALKLDPKAFASADDALKAVLDRLSQIESEAERQALAKMLGIEAFIPLAREGAAAMQKLRDEAHSLGYVMDADIIAKAGEANDKLEALSAVTKVQLSEALVQLAPILLEVAEGIAKAATAVNELTTGFSDTVGPMQGFFKAVIDSARAAFPELDAILGLLEKLRSIGRAKREMEDRFAGSEDSTSLRLENEKFWAEYNRTHTTFTPGSFAKGGGKGGGGKKGKAERLTPVEVAELPDPEIEALMQALKYWRDIEEHAGDVKKMDLPDTSGLKTPDELFKPMTEGLKQVEDDTHAAIYSGIRGGLEAGFREGLPGMLNYLKNALLSSVLDSVAEGLTSAIMGSGGGQGGVIGSFAKIFGRGYAEGTMSSRSGMALVGEHGPEMVNLPGGSQVIPNSALRNVGMGSRAANTTVIQFDNRGAVIWEQAARQMMSYADRAAATAGVSAVAVSRRATPADISRQGGRRLG